MDSQVIITTGGILTILGVLTKIIWDNLNGKINSNSCDIKEIRDNFSTKKELRSVKDDLEKSFNSVKNDLEKDTDEIKEQINRLGDKMDRMMEMMMKQGGGSNEK